MSKKSKLIFGLLGAAAVGVVIGVLLAPEKGTNTRKKLTETAGGWADHLTDLFANAKGEISNLKNKATKASGNVADEMSKVSEKYS